MDSITAFDQVLRDAMRPQHQVKPGPPGPRDHAKKGSKINEEMVIC